MQFSELRMPYRKRLVIYCMYGLSLICYDEYVRLCIINNQISVHLYSFKTAIGTGSYMGVLQMGRYAAGLTSPACITLTAYHILLYGTITEVHHNVSIVVRVMVSFRVIVRAGVRVSRGLEVKCGPADRQRLG